MDVSRLFGLSESDIKKMVAKRDVNGLVKALAYKKNALVRIWAARALGDIGDARAVDALAVAIKDQDANVRTAATEALTKLNSDLKQEPQVSYKIGSFIGQKYIVQKELGHGGMGIVYLVYSHETDQLYALKTFKDQFLKNAKIRDMFQREANVWIDLERHPYIVRAYFLDEVSGRLYIGMEYIASDENGLNTLESYLQKQPPDLAQSLRWAIQFCYGMEYAYSRGVRCHRDIKPENIMIATDKTVKITDFGLAGILGSTVEGGGIGTPYWMPPEQFTSFAACDMRSDIYAFGIVLYQMVNGGKLPFWVPAPRKGASREEIKLFKHEICRLHRQGQIPRFDSPLFSVVQRCLEKTQDRRYQTFEELRTDLERLLKRLTGEVVELPTPSEFEEWELNNKGISLKNLGRYTEAIECYDRALEINPQNAEIWDNKGMALRNLRRYGEAIKCCDEALEINPRLAGAWMNKGNILHDLGRFEEAIKCHDRALEINPQYANAPSWVNKGNSLHALRRFEEAIECCDEALEIDPQIAEAWVNKGISLSALGRFEEAIECCDEALEIDPQNAQIWVLKGSSLDRLRRFGEAIECYDRALEINPKNAGAWNNRAISLGKLGRFGEAIECYDRALEIDPQNAEIWDNKGRSLGKLGRNEEAIECLDKILEINPKNEVAWVNKGTTYFSLGRNEEALECFDKALEINPQIAEAWVNKGIILSSLGRNEEALECFDKALEINPQNAQIWVKEGTILYDLGRFLEALECYDETLEINPRDVTAWIYKGTCLSNLDYHDEALECFDKALELEPKNEVAWINKGSTLENLYRFAEAKKCYRRFLELAPAKQTELIEYVRNHLQQLERKRWTRFLERGKGV